MTGDIRKQLVEALDHAERLAKAAIQGPWRTGADVAHLVDYVIYGLSPINPERIVQVANVEAAWQREDNAAHIARWDPSTVLRLVAYFREELQEIDGELADDPADETAQGRLSGVAAFWLGTPEGDHG